MNRLDICFGTIIEFSLDISFWMWLGWLSHFNSHALSSGRILRNLKSPSQYFVKKKGEGLEGLILS